MNLKNIEKCTLIEILKYFEDIIGDEGYNVLLNAISSDLDWNEELFKKSYSIAANETKRKLVRQIYARYYDELSKPKNKNKMQVLEKMILEDKKCETLTCNIDGVIKHYILTGQPQKSVDSIKNSETRETVITSFSKTFFLSYLKVVFQKNDLYFINDYPHI